MKLSKKDSEAFQIERERVNQRTKVDFTDDSEAPIDPLIKPLVPIIEQNPLMYCLGSCEGHTPEEIKNGAGKYNQTKSWGSLSLVFPTREIRDFYLKDLPVTLKGKPSRERALNFKWYYLYREEVINFLMTHLAKNPCPR